VISSILFGAGMMCLVFAALGLHGGPYVRKSFPVGADKTPPDLDGRTPPRVSVLVPLTGKGDNMDAAVSSLLRQDYPDHEILFCLGREDDPAAALVDRATKHAPRAKKVFAGLARRCGQKNHNLLAGIRAADTQSEIFVTVDSTHIARPDFVSHLVAPIVRGQAQVTCGFHRIAPENGGHRRIAVCSWQLMNLIIHLLHPIRAITQPWGGATGVTRQAFERYDISSVWGKTIVDDVPLGLNLKKRGRIRTWPVAMACLFTPCQSVPWPWLTTWWQRQIHYMKYYTPTAWVGLGLLFLILNLSLAGLPLILGLSLAGIVPVWAGWAALGLVLVFCATGEMYRFLLTPQRPARPAFWSWLAGLCLTALLSLLAWLKSAVSNTVSWHATDYRMGWGGDVRQIERQEPKPEP
jgi:ceramide glucosyltransferase